jgi:hypothetical protein
VASRPPRVTPRPDLTIVERPVAELGCVQTDEIQQDGRLRLKRPELSRVTLTRDVSSEDGLVPAGSSGTIVHVYSSGPAYEVEFTMPFHTVATVEADDLAP